MPAIIERVDVIEYGYRAANLSRDDKLNLIAVEGGGLELTSFAVMVRDSDGAEGVYAPMFGGKKAHLGQVLMVAPLLPGRRVDERGRIWEDLKRALRQVGFVGVGALDIALWDLAGRRCGLPVVDMLGRVRERLPAYASTTHASEEGTLNSTEAFAAFALRCRELGYPAFKIHGWTDGDVRREIANLEHVRAAIGDGMRLMIDPACVLETFADALELGRACDRTGCFWYEDPMRDAGISQHGARQLRERIRTPLLLTEHVRGVEAKADWIASRSTDFVRADPDLDLGITGTMKIAALAEAFGLDIEIHACGPAHRHCMGAIRNTNFYELALVSPGAPNPVPPVFACGYSEQLEDVGPDGCFPVPVARPGLGVVYDLNFIRRHAHQTHTYGA